MSVLKIPQHLLCQQYDCSLDMACCYLDLILSLMSRFSAQYTHVDDNHGVIMRFMAVVYHKNIVELEDDISKVVLLPIWDRISRAAYMMLELKGVMRILANFRAIAFPSWHSKDTDLIRLIKLETTFKKMIVFQYPLETVADRSLFYFFEWYYGLSRPTGVNDYISKVKEHLFECKIELPQ